ncbi:MAG: hypothetical protein OXC91_04330, partial [Rhodobacteraceae bacterium]|nr:hypothetical protein [Paracoccaceae bacterium]
MPVTSTLPITLQDVAEEFDNDYPDNFPYGLTQFLAGASTNYTPAGTVNGAGNAIPSAVPINLTDFLGASKGLPGIRNLRVTQITAVSALLTWEWPVEPPTHTIVSASIDAYAGNVRISGNEGPPNASYRLGVDTQRLVPNTDYRVEMRVFWRPLAPPRTVVLGSRVAEVEFTTLTALQRSRDFYVRSILEPVAPNDASFDVYADSPIGGWSITELMPTETMAVWTITLVQTFGQMPFNEMNFLENMWSEVKKFKDALGPVRTRMRTFYRRATGSFPYVRPAGASLGGFASYTTPISGWSVVDPGATVPAFTQELLQTFRRDFTEENWQSNTWGPVTYRPPQTNDAVLKATIVGPETARLNEEVRLTFAVTGTARNQTPASHVWSGGGTGPFVQFTRNTAGDHTVTIQVNRGPYIATDSHTVVFSGFAVSITADPGLEVVTGTTVTLTAVPTPAGGNITYIWSGDASGTSQTATVTSAVVGRATATVVVQKGTESATASISIRFVANTTRSKKYYRNAATRPNAPSGTAFAIFDQSSIGAWQDTIPAPAIVNGEEGPQWEVTLTQYFNSNTKDASSFVRNEWSAVTQLNANRITAVINALTGGDCYTANQIYTITSSVSGGTPPYTYNWSGDVSGTNSDAVFRPTRAGASYEFSLRVVDDAGLSALATVTACVEQGDRTSRSYVYYANSSLDTGLQGPSSQSVSLGATIRAGGVTWSRVRDPSSETNNGATASENVWAVSVTQVFQEPDNREEYDPRDFLRNEWGTPAIVYNKLGLT